MEDIKQTLPCIPLRGETILPGMITQIDLKRTKSIMAVEEALGKQSHIFVIAQTEEDVEEPDMNTLQSVGTIAKVGKVSKFSQDSVMRVQVEGIQPAYLVSFPQDGEMFLAEVAPVEPSKETGLAPAAEEAMLRTMHELIIAYLFVAPGISRDMRMKLQESRDLVYLVNQVPVFIRMKPKDQQRYLEAFTFPEKYEIVTQVLAYETEVLSIHAEIQQQVKQEVDKHQREYILRQQIKTIREELGEEGTDQEIMRMEEETEALDAPVYVIEKLKQEIKRLRSTMGNASEATVIRGYIETLLALPWEKRSKDSRSIARARKILDADHYGLKEVKERILEYLAVRILNSKGEAPILCLYGPPGTGKTSIATSVAKALNKKFVRISLGGMRDEAEIRGHRRTYVGAMPGRIAAGLKQAGVKNPLILLDEIDKSSSDYRGAISSALLEVLDPVENSHFADHYVDLPLDLSEVLFIATANDPSEIPGPLQDRMELIEISSYTEDEKFHIASEHLIPKQMKLNGLKKTQLQLDEETIRLIITGYTREAGVRSLERQIGRICRKTALMIEETKCKRIRLTADKLEEFLGFPKYRRTEQDFTPKIGVVRGLAWTRVGGEMLDVEVLITPGKGQLKLTGRLGDVMKESAVAAMTYLRSIAEQKGVEANYFDEHDFHLHVPAGAVPKDGPSAGVTISTALYSAVLGKKVAQDVAMTGEITLSGRVLPIGGLKEKLLAARNAGIRTVLVPHDNEKDVREIEDELKEGLRIVFVKHITEVFQEAIPEEEK